MQLNQIATHHPPCSSAFALLHQHSEQSLIGRRTRVGFARKTRGRRGMMHLQAPSHARWYGWGLLQSAGTIDRPSALLQFDASMTPGKPISYTRRYDLNYDPREKAPATVGGGGATGIL